MRAELPNSTAPAELDSIDAQRTIDVRTLHPQATFLRILGVNYVHIVTPDGGDLYLTIHGVPFRRHLDPKNWFVDPWFKQHRERLAGTSTVYKVLTQPIPGHRIPSIDVVVKWSRVGQDMALDTLTLDRNVDAEFNTPFEEFARLQELRQGEQGPSRLRILTQKPLAIYVPPEQMQPWQTGRSRDKILLRTARHPGVEIDVLRAYIMLYGWVKGLSSIEAMKHCPIAMEEQQKQLEELTHRVEAELNERRFMVVDHKPTHFILRFNDGKLLRRRDGKLVYALVDYELLSRTADYEDWALAAKRREYLMRQKERFLPHPTSAYPPQIRPARVLEVEYVCGRALSTNGMLWVVGNDPELFQYFLPERWRSNQQMRLSTHPQTYYAQTKDRIHLVWKVSRVGEIPEGDLADPAYKRLLLQGFNSPFEEFSLAMKMMRKGIRTAYPRAIYMTASPGAVSGPVLDDRAFERMQGLRSPAGDLVMPLKHDYITIWGYFRGLDDELAVDDTALWTPIGLGSAASKGIIDEAATVRLMQRHADQLEAAGFCDSNPKRDHVLISYIPSGGVKTGHDGQIETRQCNFELVKQL